MKRNKWDIHRIHEEVKMRVVVRKPLTPGEGEVLAKEIVDALKAYVEAGKKWERRFDPFWNAAFFFVEHIPALCVLAALGRPGARKTAGKEGLLAFQCRRY